MPGVIAYHRGKVCSGGVNLGPTGLVVGGGCSLENVGAIARRVMQGRVLRDERF